MHSFEAFITDLDGTLCDTLQANIAAYRRAFADARLAFDEQMYRAHFGLRFDEMIARLAPQADASAKQQISHQKSLHYQSCMDLVTLNYGLVKLLEHMKQSGHKLALVTTAKKQNASLILHHFSLEELFDVHIFGEDVKHGKPDPECYKLAIDRLGSQPANCLVYEDSDIGVAAADSSGAATLRVSV